jgi:hypothetical protein
LKAISRFRSILARSCEDDLSSLLRRVSPKGEIRSGGPAWFVFAFFVLFVALASSPAHFEFVFAFFAHRFPARGEGFVFANSVLFVALAFALPRSGSRGAAEDQRSSSFSQILFFGTDAPAAQQDYYVYHYTHRLMFLSITD